MKRVKSLSLPRIEHATVVRSTVRFVPLTRLLRATGNEAAATVREEVRRRACDREAEAARPGYVTGYCCTC